MKIAIIDPVVGTSDEVLAADAASISEKVAVITTDSYGVICEGRKAREHGFESVMIGMKMLELTISLQDTNLIKSTPINMDEYIR